MGKETLNEKRQQKEEKKSGILCTTPQNNTGKVIFEDNNLCCQFLNDYVDLPHFKDVRPEDIEDVSEEFVPLFSNEREADRIKENIEDSLTEKVERIYEFPKFLHVLSVGFDDDEVECISNMDFVAVMNAINVHYANIA